MTSKLEAKRLGKLNMMISTQIVMDDPLKEAMQQSMVKCYEDRFMNSEEKEICKNSVLSTYDELKNRNQLSKKQIKNLVDKAYKNVEEKNKKLFY